MIRLAFFMMMVGVSAAEANCAFIRDPDQRNLCYGRCAFIRDADLRNSCDGRCAFIRAHDLRQMCLARRR